MRYVCPYCDRKHWFYTTTMICHERWLEARRRGLSR